MGNRQTGRQIKFKISCFYLGILNIKKTLFLDKYFDRVVFVPDPVIRRNKNVRLMFSSEKKNSSKVRIYFYQINELLNYCFQINMERDPGRFTNVVV